MTKNGKKKVHVFTRITEEESRYFDRWWRENGYQDQSKAVRKALALLMHGKTGAANAQLELTLKELGETKQALGKVGTNLNQLVHYFNRTGFDIAPDLKDEHTALRQIFKEVMEKLEVVENDVRKQTV